MDGDSNDFVSMINNTLCKDGQNTPTANLPMATFIHTGVGNATARTNYAAAGQVQDDTFTWGATSTGSANAQTIGPTPAITAYAAGQRFRFIAGYTNTGTTTLAISGLTAKNIYKFGASGPVACAGGEIVATNIIEVQYDGTQFQLLSNIPPALITGANPTATASDTAVNGSATTFMRSDGAPAVQKASNSQFGIVEVDGATIIAVSGVISAPSVNPTGVVVPFAGSSAPTGWLLCYGQAISRSTYAALFSAISTTYGSGDGSTTFNLPDLRGRAAFGVDNMGGSAANRITNAVSGITGTTLGATGGDQNMQSHSHTVASIPIPSGAVNNLTGGSSGSYSTLPSSTTGSGSSQNMPPAMMLNYIIKT